jgi:hypothetical protein
MSISREASIQEYMTTAQAAAYLNISKQWLEARRSCGGDAPPVVRIGRACRYRRSTLDQWALRREQNSPSLAVNRTEGF